MFGIRAGKRCLDYETARKPIAGGGGGVNPLSPNSDQHQFYPNDIHTMSGG